MEINEYNNFSSDSTNNQAVNVYDIPGHGFFKIKITELLPSAKMFFIFIDSSDK